MAVSKLSAKCQNCKLVDVCDNKRMAACATLPLIEQITAPMAREYTPITINMGEYGTINTSAEEIKEKINKSIEEKLYKGLYCGFNKS